MKKRSKGFTLVELVAVQVIICLLLIVTVPQAKLLLRKSRIQRLDERAQSLFLLTQNRLSNLAASDELKKLRDLSVCGTGTEGSFYLAFGFDGLLPACTHDAESFKPVTELLKYEELADKVMEKGCFVIEYRPAEGRVSAVYCSDSRFNYNSSGSDSVCTKKGTQDWEEWRRENRIGFYSCSGEAYSRVQNGRVNIGLKTVNGEELLLYVKGSAIMDEDPEFSDYDPDSWKLKLELRGVESGFKTEFEPGSGVYIKQLRSDSSFIEYTVYLDSPNVGRGFTELYPGFIPGEDIVIKAELYYIGEEACLNYGTSHSCRVNSMFYAKEGEYYIISSIRHQSNLALIPGAGYMQLGDLA